MFSWRGVYTLGFVMRGLAEMLSFWEGEGDVLL
jgi:hypothetical protein